MTYTKTTWSNSTELTSARLNNMETQFDAGKADFEAHVHTSDYYTRTQMETTFWSADNDGSGSGLDADMIIGPTGAVHGSEATGMGVPAGVIIMWWGAVTDVPYGWRLCNGNDGTPDLGTKYIVGAGDVYSLGDTGGTSTFIATGDFAVNSHTLTTNEIPAHTHSFTDTYSPSTGSLVQNSSTLAAGPSARTGTTETSGGGQGHAHAGSSISVNSVSMMPSYVVLCYIMKYDP